MHQRLNSLEEVQMQLNDKDIRNIIEEVVKRYLAYAPRGVVTDYHNTEQFKEVIEALKAY